MVLVVEQFLRSLRESQLIPAEEVASLQKALLATKTQHTVEEVSRLLVEGGKLTEFQADAIVQGRPQSLILGEYVLLDVLGKGGMGVVFRARHRLMDRVVAVKTLSTAALKPDTVQRFFREVKAVARLSHPNIVTAFDAGEHAGTHYLVMEYVVGRDLSAIVRQNGPLPLRQAIDYVQQTARGLEYAHSHGIIHRDVKPGNLLLSQASVVKILDMGLARLNENLGDSSSGMDLTGTGQILGTIDYMSPEQAEDVRSADHRSDIYSLGCTLFFLLTRRPVFPGETVLKRILAHRSQPVPSLMALRPDCPESLEAMLRRMLAKQPADRPQTMSEIIADLDSCLAKPDAAPPVGNLSASADPAKNWLEDLVDENAADSTDGSHAHDATLDSPSDTANPPSGGETSAHRSKATTHRRAARKSTSSVGRRKSLWKPAFLAAAVIAAAAAGAIMYDRLGVPAAPKDAAENPLPTADAGEDSAKKVVAESPVKPNADQSADWARAWADAQRNADRMVANRQFAQAIREYATLESRFSDLVLRQKCQADIHRIETAADAAFAAVEKTARQHMGQRRFAQARTILQPVLENYSSASTKARARQLIAEIDRAEREAAPPPASPPIRADSPALSPALVKQRQLEANYSSALAAVERRAAVWDFLGASREADALHFDAPELNARLAQRREQLRRLADLKDRMAAAVNGADPHLQKIDLALRGINGELDKADADGLTATLPNGKQEQVAWSSLGSKAVNNFLSRVVRREDGGDWLAAGLLSLIDQDVPAAERFFDKARSLGTDTSSSAALLAERDFAAVGDLLSQRQYAQAGERLAALKTKYGTLPWFAAKGPELDAAGQESRRGLRNAEAEAIFTQAAGLSRGGDPYELKPLVERLRTEYADSVAAADPQRKLSLAKWEKAVADLGPLLRVRKDGTGDARNVQEAVSKAPHNATIEIEEAGPWTELLKVPAGTEGLTIRGKKGVLPVITTAGAANGYSEALLVDARQLSLQRLVIVRSAAGAAAGNAVSAERTALSLREVVVCGHLRAENLDCRQTVVTASVRAARDIAAADSVIFGHLAANRACSLENVLACAGPAAARPRVSVIARSAALCSWLVFRARFPTVS